MIKLLRSALVSSSPPFTLAAKCRPYSCAEYSRGKETITVDTLYSERYSDFGRHCTGDNYLSALSALRLQETTHFELLGYTFTVHFYGTSSILNGTKL